MARMNYAFHWFNEQYPGGAGGFVSLNVYTNYGTVPKARIYLDGSGPPAFTDISSSLFLQLNPAAAGVYRIEFTNNEYASVPQLLCKVEVLSYAADCWDKVVAPSYRENGSNGFISVLDSKVSILHSIAFVNPASQVVDRSRSISIDNGLTYKTVNSFGVSEWSNSELASLGLANEILLVKIKRTSDSCQVTQATVIKVEDVVYAPLSASYSKTNCSATGSNDGTVTLSVSGGSGSYTFDWADGPATQNRSALSPGSYTVTVTDDVTAEVIVLGPIDITEPQPPPPPSAVGHILEIPLLNSLTFVVDPVDPEVNPELMTLDNILFCHRHLLEPLGTQTEYFQKVQQSRVRLLQFYSDYASHEVTMRKLSDGSIVRTFPAQLVEQNIGVVEQFNIKIANHPSMANRARVYFGSVAIPLPVSVGDTFEIFNNVDGYDGLYSILAIGIDTITNSQYLLINLNYVGPFNVSVAQSKFIISAVDFNVYEAVLDMSGLNNGKYYFQVHAFDNVDNFKDGFSEPCLLKPFHRNTNLLRYSNNDNADDITWTTGYVGEMLIESTFGNKPDAGGVRATSRDADYSLTKVSAKKTRVVPFETGPLPGWLHFKLGCVFDLDNFTINSVRCQTDQPYAKAKYPDNGLLGTSSIDVEQMNLFTRYNSTDLGGSVDSGSGFLANETGLIKL